MPEIDDDDDDDDGDKYDDYGGFSSSQRISNTMSTRGRGALWANLEAHTPFWDKNGKKEKYHICKHFHFFSESL